MVKAKGVVLRRAELFCAVLLLAVVGGIAAVFNGNNTRASAAATGYNLEVTDDYLNITPIGSQYIETGILFIKQGHISNGSGMFDYNGGDWISLSDYSTVFAITQFTTVSINLRDLVNSGTLPQNVELTIYAVQLEGDFSATIYHTIVLSDFVALPPDPVKAGHTFVGWFYDSAFTEPYSGAAIYEDTTLYAKFVVNQHTITFNTDGGSVVGPVTVNWGTNYSTLPVSTKVGHTFKGWTLNSQPYSGGVITEDITLVAEWELIILTVTFMNGDSVYVTLQVPYGMSLVEVVQSSGMSIFNNFLDSTGFKLDNATAVVGDMVLSVVEMTGFEKFVTWVQNYWWFPLVCLGFLLCVVFVIKIIRKVRG
jgi:uncharacterized repeat protein (TIGR02543 family)